MAAITDYNEYVSKLKENRAADFVMSAAIGRAQRLTALFPFFVPAPTIPGASAVCDKNSQQAITSYLDTGGRLTLLAARLNASLLSGCAIIVIDLLNISGGYNATTIFHTVSTPALTRHTNGEGVMAAAIIYQVVGTTATIIQPTYTDAASNSRTASQTTFGGTANREGGSVIPIPQAAGLSADTTRGFLSVESVTLGASTGTAGNFGVMMYKPLAMFSMDSTTGVAPLDAVSTGGIIGSLAEIHPDACLTLLAVSNVAQSINGAILFQDI
jgi:hypothetical protein